MFKNGRRRAASTFAAVPVTTNLPLHMSSAQPSRILIVDDHAENLLALEALLEPMGQPVERAENGRQAVRKALQHDFAVILMDVQMRELDGFETAALLKQSERTKRIPIIFLTAAMLDAAYIAEGYKHGAVDYLLKPIEPRILRSKVGVFVDLHQAKEELKRQGELLRQRELEDLQRANDARYHALAEAMPLLVWTARPDGALDSFNRRWVDYTGMSAAQSEGWGWLDAVHPEDVQRCRAAWTAAVQEGVGSEIECRFRRSSDGSYRWHLGRSVPVRGPTGELSRWVGTLTDIDDQKRLSTENARLYQNAQKSMLEAQEAILLRDEFLSVASHELKTPLTPLNLTLTALERAVEQRATPLERIARDLSTARRHVRKLAALVEGLLDVSRIRAGKLELTLENVDLREVIQEVVSRFAPQAAQAGSELVPQLPEEDLSGCWDRLRLEQIVTNLISNALKYGAGKPVELRLVGTSDQVTLIVRDQGIGMQADVLGRIFGRFERGHSNRNYGGLGLGLYIARQIVVALGGAISVQSAPGKGSTFTVQLPRARLGDRAMSGGTAANA